LAEAGQLVLQGLPVGAGAMRCGPGRAVSLTGPDIRAPGGPAAGRAAAVGCGTAVRRSTAAVRSEERRVGKERRCAGSAGWSSRRRHTRSKRDWSSDVCSSDLLAEAGQLVLQGLPVGAGAMRCGPGRAVSLTGPDIRAPGGPAAGRAAAVGCGTAVRRSTAAV